MDDKQQNFYKRLLINIRVKCLKQGIKKSEFCLKQGRKISDICLKQGQGMRGRAAPPYRGIYRVPPRDFRIPWNSRNTHKIKEEVRDFGSEVKFFTITATMVNATTIFKTDGSKNVINIARWLLNFRGLVFL